MMHVLINGRQIVFVAAGWALMSFGAPSAQGQGSVSAQRAVAARNQALAQQQYAARQAAPQARKTQQPMFARQGGTGRVSGTASSRATAGVRPTAAGGSLQGMRTALHMFAADTGRMPTAAEGLQALIQAPPGVKNWRGPYISTNNWRTTFADPWGNLYRYVVQGTPPAQTHSIISNGPDGLPGTRDDLQVQF